jgi:hypothetical protein
MLVAIMVSTAGHEFSLQSLANIIFMPSSPQEISRMAGGWLSPMMNL